MPTLFEKAGAVFDGWTDPETGLRVLRLHTRGSGPKGVIWSTMYHQFRCFLDGGRRVLLRERPCPPSGPSHEFLLDLTTGRTERPFPAGHSVVEVADATGMAALVAGEADGSRSILWNLRTGREEASVRTDGWTLNTPCLLPDGRRALVFHHLGQPYQDRVQSRHILLTPGEPPRTVLEADGYFCSHIQGCPTDPDLYTYDRWPSPARDIEQALHLRRLDGSLHEPVPLAPDAGRPGNMWGARDHYLWTLDGRRLVSYFCPDPIRLGPDFNHFRLNWRLSALDWRTGQDWAAAYPPGRWGGHMQVSPDSRWIVCTGGPGYDRLFLVSIEGLRRGWNETPVCSYPRNTFSGKNEGPFSYPAVLPDQSGILFNAGWPGPEHGVYLAAWPKTT
jgi:hypothetical protein